MKTRRIRPRSALAATTAFAQQPDLVNARVVGTGRAARRRARDSGDRESAG